MSTPDHIHQSTPAGESLNSFIGCSHNHTPTLLSYEPSTNENRIRFQSTLVSSMLTNHSSCSHHHHHDNQVLHHQQIQPPFHHHHHSTACTTAAVITHTGISGRAHRHPSTQRINESSNEPNRLSITSSSIEHQPDSFSMVDTTTTELDQHSNVVHPKQVSPFECSESSSGGGANQPHSEISSRIASTDENNPSESDDNSTRKCLKNVSA